MISKIRLRSGLVSVLHREIRAGIIGFAILGILYFGLGLSTTVAAVAGLVAFAYLSRQTRKKNTT